MGVGAGRWLTFTNIYEFLTKHNRGRFFQRLIVLNLALNAHIRCANPQSLKKKSKAHVFFALTSPSPAPLRLNSVSKDNHRFEELGCSDMWVEAVGGELLEEISF